MKRVRGTLLLAAIAWVAGSVPAPAQIALTKNADLNFGSMVSGTSAGTVTVTSTGAVSSTGGVTLVPSTTAPADFTLSNGPAGGPHIYLIQLPSSVTITSGGNSMVVNNFDNTAPTLGIIANSSSRSIGVGATLNVGANQPSGTYTGTYLMMVAFL